MFTVEGRGEAQEAGESNTKADKDPWRWGESVEKEKGKDIKKLEGERSRIFKTRVENGMGTT